ncbi:MAG: ABC transporter ATP-binding protein [Syntrophobacteraceae bacterium]|jgi:branched-chain amino acid transport system ATP-binding protein
MLSLHNVSSSYGDIRILKNINLSVRPREIMTIVGSNGAGKSTLINLISGIVRCTAGEVFFGDERIDSLAPHEIVERGIVQIPEGRMLFPEMTVMENLDMGAYIARASAKKKERLKEVFTLFPKLEERKKQIAGSLSGGEQQMVAIARGIMSDPKLLMFDEPSLGLAPVVVEDMFKIIRKINSRGIAVLLVEQNVFHALAIADRAFVLENGEVVMEGTGQEILSNDRIREAYLGI